MLPISLLRLVSVVLGVVPCIDDLLVGMLSRDGGCWGYGRDSSGGSGCCGC